MALKRRHEGTEITTNVWNYDSDKDKSKVDRGIAFFN